MKNKINRLIKLTQVIIKTTKNSRLPLFSNKYSKHTYKQYQHVSILCFMKYMKLNYRSVIQLLELIPKIKQLIGLNQLPHYTTIHKFFQRFNHVLFNRLLSQTANLFNTGNCILSIDSTGYSSNYASSYYTRRLKGRYTIRQHIKSSITVDTGNQLVVSNKNRLGPRHDNIDFVYLLTNASRTVNINTLVADKGYDSELNHRLVRQLNANPIIPLRDCVRYRVIGRYRRRMLKEFNEKLYHRRSINETVFSVVKRLFGSWVQSRSLKLQIKEITLMYLVYNIHRYVSYFVILLRISTKPEDQKLYKYSNVIINK